MKIKRPLIRIDEEKCTGCGDCVTACQEGAIAVIDGKARLVREIFCDGLGACLGHCPTGALTIEEVEAEPFDEEAVAEHLAAPAPQPATPAHFGGCPGSAIRQMSPAPARGPAFASTEPSALGHWPVQLTLVPPIAPFLRQADLLLCADCVPFTLAGFHQRYLNGRAVLVGCPKLDDLAHYQEKLTAILSVAKPRSLTVLRMEVPCCGGLAYAALNARDAAGIDLPVEIHTISIDGLVRQREMIPPRPAVSQKSTA